uniref:Uncharacterized protein n=1 Tax=Pyramimonas obovata TaxID=1411642 RepID=A0A6T7Z3G5_9CHLO|mmetsp:Transcript_7387/g.15067  ORF Transcript_7387/g.15067 Transcript_7387/m.15067 type:complete len:140 (+) Transcript_7387:174-593(+)
MSRYAGDQNVQKLLGSVMGKILTRTEMAEALKGDNFKVLKRMIAQDYLASVKEKFTPEKVQRALDVGGGTNKCWQEIFKTMESAFADSGLNIRAGQWFHVQSETELWPVCMFEVKKESHAALKRYLKPSRLSKSSSVQS